MSKIKKGIKMLFTQGPVAVLKKVCEVCHDRAREKNNLDIIKTFHLISKEERAKQKRTEFKNPQKFSILTPLYNTPENYLIELLESMKKQTYAEWELCLADGSDEKHAYVGEICKKYAKQDSRIVYSTLKKNEGISGNTNACMKLATGTYYGLLDHDDILHESALFEMMQAIENTGADFLYSDEAKFSVNIEEISGFNLKPGYGKDELRAHNYICHFTVFSRRLIENCGEVYRSEFDGSQDHDMVLRLTEKAEKIVHIPKILYYWRVHPGSVSMNLDSKSYAVDAAIRAVTEQLKRTDELGEVESVYPYRTLYRIRYQIERKDKVIVLVHHLKNNEQFDRMKKEILQKTSYKNCEIVKINLKGNETFAEACNRTVEESEGDYYVFMHADVRPISETWIEEMLMFAQRKDVCGVSPKVLYQDNSIAYAGISIQKEDDKIKLLNQHVSNENHGYEAMLWHVRNTTSVWKGCCMFSGDVWQKLGGFHTGLCGYEDIDISLRGIQAGFWNVWTCFAIMEYQRKQIDDFKTGDTAAFAEVWQEIINREDQFCHPVLKKLGLI